MDNRADRTWESLRGFVGVWQVRCSWEVGEGEFYMSDITLDDFTITEDTRMGESAQAICNCNPERFKAGNMLSVIYVEQTEVSDPEDNVYIPHACEMLWGKSVLRRNRRRTL